MRLRGEAGRGMLIARLPPARVGLTNLTTIRRNSDILKHGKFGMEYLGHFGRAAGTDSLFSVEAWESTTGEGAPPEGVPAASLAFAVHPGGLWSSIVVAWHLPDETPDFARAAWALEGNDDDAAEVRAGFKLIHHQEGNARMAATLWKYWKLLRLPINHDDAPQEKAIMQELMRNAPRKPQTGLVRFGDKSVAATKLVNGIKHKRLEHWRQEPMDDAARIAVPRIAGKSRLIGGPDDAADITPLEAASIAILRLPAPKAEGSFGPIMG